MEKKTKLTLVGAGPGDADLITVKGIKALMKADVVLYDALVNPTLLEYAPLDAPRIFVGKKIGNHYLQQTEINALIVDKAFRYGHVVRLKGGDSFVFGRGKEEIDYAEAFGIETEIVPGISSALAVPALQGIPLTHRGTSESFWVITGTTKNHRLSQDLFHAVQSTATIVILMGMHRLGEIVAIFKQFNQNEKPIAIIQNGSAKDEKVVIGTIENIVAMAEKAQIGSPAIIVVGEVVKSPLPPEGNISTQVSCRRIYDKLS
jgi:uroporphyrin-III C-methyltransferase